MHIAVIITCHNRKEKTLHCLTNLFEAKKAYGHNEVRLAVFLTDDGCTDGTAEAVDQLFDRHEIHIIKGDGSLYWAGGMRAAWREALKEKKRWDYYLLVNDDTYAFDNLFTEMIEAHRYCLRTYKRPGLYSGVTCAQGQPDVITYGGDREDRLCRLHRVMPNGQPQLVDEANANLLLVPAMIVNEIGIFYEGYVHGSADYDYSRLARRNNIPVLITAHTCGECEYDHDSMRQEAKKLFSMNLSERRRYLNSPLHSDPEYLLYIRRNMPLRLPITLLLRKTRLYFPHIYYVFNKLRGIQ